MPRSVVNADVATLNLHAARPRYALYFAPGADTVLGRAGSAWLGRDADRDCLLAQPALTASDLTATQRMPELAALTTTARHYGFHATLKAPFRLAAGFEETDLLAMAEAFCQRQALVALPRLQVRLFDDFLALRPETDAPDIAALAQRCVAYFDLLRAPPTAAELARRRLQPLTARQEALLQRWGYPYTEEEFRFHMTLSDRIAGRANPVASAAEPADITAPATSPRYGDALHADASDTVARALVSMLMRTATAHFAAVLAEPRLMIDSVSVMREGLHGAPWTLLARLPLSASGRSSGLPEPGRLFYMVGPSGVGKDALLRWLREQVQRGDVAQPGHPPPLFARRIITRAAEPNEDHVPIDAAAFAQQEQAGCYALHWHANGLSYGIARTIDAALAAGRDVLVNGSREHVPQVWQRYPDATVLWISAEREVVARRLAARGRESGEALRQRVERGARFGPPADPRIVVIDNSAGIDVAGGRLLALLQSRRPD